MGLSFGFWLGLGLPWDHIKDNKFFIYTTFNDFSLNVYDDLHVLHLVSDSQGLSFFQELTPTLTLVLRLQLGIVSAWCHLEHKKLLIYTTFKHFFLDVYHDIHVFHFLLDSQRLSFFQELTPTLTLGLSLPLGLGSAWGHLEHKKLLIYTFFKHFFLDVYHDIHVFHFVLDFQRFSFFQELTPTLTLGLSLGLGLGSAWGHLEHKKFFIYTTFKHFFLDVYHDIHVFPFVLDFQRLSFFQELTPTLTLGLSLGLGLGSAWGHLEHKKFFIYITFKHFFLDVYHDIHVFPFVLDFQRLSFFQD